MKALFSIVLFLMISGSIYSQNTDLPYKLLPEPEKKYTAGTVAARTVDGLGFRYYWATEGLTEENLAYKANEDGRTIAETLDHIWSLTRITKNSAIKEATTFDENERLVYTKALLFRVFNLNGVHKCFEGPGLSTTAPAHKNRGVIFEG